MIDLRPAFYGFISLIVGVIWLTGIILWFYGYLLINWMIVWGWPIAIIEIIIVIIAVRTILGKE
jgi:hypothetical protein